MPGATAPNSEPARALRMEGGFTIAFGACLLKRLLSRHPFVTDDCKGDER